MEKPDLIIDTNERGSLCESIERKARKEGLNVSITWTQTMNASS